MLFFLSLATALLSSIYLCRLIWYKRFIQYAKFPQLPPSLLLGHLKIYSNLAQSGPPDRDYDHIFSEIHEILGRPPLVLIDYRPICRPVLFIASHEIAEQISRPTKLFRSSVPKLDLSYLKPIIGRTSMLSAEGDEWRALRKTFSPWFSLQHLMTLLPAIVDKTMVFINHLDRLSDSRDEVSLVSLTMNLMFDIIGAAILDVDLNAQHMDPCQRGEAVRAFTELLNAYWDDKIHLPWWCKLPSELKRRHRAKRVDRILRSIISQKHEQNQQQQQQQAHRGVEEKFAQSQPLPDIISLSLRDADTQFPLPQDVLDRTCDQLRTFLLGGHDSPSATLAWAIYELSRTPRALSAVRAELDALLGPCTDANAVCSRLASPEGPELLSRMSYIMAVLKETLRLHTSASTARYSPPGSGLVVTTPAGEELGLDDVIIYNCNSIIHRDPAVFGSTAHCFMPERWLDDSNDKTSMPPSAWRPFERGPRACIGQEFASIVMRVIIAAVARQFEFTKVGLGELALDATTGRPILGCDGQYEVRSHVYNTRQITARPVDDMMVKVRRVQRKNIYL
ncbi:cytochrome P450 monooxygenase [Aspergillus nidulans var. acristatus]